MSSSGGDWSASDAPYPGPRPFETGQEALFFGRETETANIASLVIARRTVVIYSESGAGKSSLLRAGLIPALRAREVEVLLPIGRVRAPAEGTASPPPDGNIYVHNLLRVMASNSPERSPADDSKSIAEYLRRIPHGLSAEGEPLLRVLVVDQFEELFTTHPDRWPDRGGFLGQIQEALDADPLLRVVFAMRGDYIARLQSLSTVVDDGLRCRVQLERLRESAALDAVRGPLQTTRRSFDPGVAESLVQSLLHITVEGPDGTTQSVPGEFVEPVQLQIVCEGLWNSLPPNVERITKTHVDTYGKVGQALARFYRDAIEATVIRTSVDEVALRSWFDRQLITPAGTRGTVFRGQRETAGIPNDSVEMLEDLHIIRSEMRSGSRWYELSHDLFIRAVESDNRDRFEELAAKAASEQEAAAAIRRKRMTRAGLLVGALGVLVAVLIGVLLSLKNEAADTNARLQEERQDQRVNLVTAEQARAAALEILGHDGRIVFWSNRDGIEQIYEISADGTGEVRLSDATGDDAFPAVSPDAKKIVFRRKVEGRPQLFLMNRDGSGATRLTSSNGQDTFPSWSPDGKRIVFQSDRHGPPNVYELYVVNADGSGERRLTDHPADDQLPSWSPDGRTIAFQSNRDGVHRVWTISADGTGAPTRLTGDGADEFTPVWSPDGQRIAFESTRDPIAPNNKRLYIADRDGRNVTGIPNNGSADGAPAWSPDGERIAFRSNRDGPDQIYLVSPDGSQTSRVTNSPGADRGPRWVGGS